MKKHTLSIIAATLCMISSTVIAQVCNNCNPSLPINTGLLSCYPFSNSPNDASGNNNHGTSPSVQYTADRFGNGNNALLVNDTTNYLTITNNSLKVNQFTYSVWVNVQNLPTATTSIISLGNSLVDQAILLGPGIGFGLASYNSDGTYSSSVISGSAPSLNTWYHVVMVRNSTTVGLYVNGNLSASKSIAGKTPGYGTSNFGAYIGRRTGNVPQYFKGKIDDVRIFNRALSTNEISQLYGLTNDTLATTISDNSHVCLGDSIQLTATGGTNYSWTSSAGMSNPTQANPYVSPVTTTKYYVTISYQNCSVTDSVIITVDTPITVNAGIDNSLCLGDSISLQATGAQSYEWSPFIGLDNPMVANPKASPFKTTDYIVRGISGACKAQDTIRVSVCVCSQTTVYDTVTVYDTIRVAVTDTLIIDIAVGLNPTQSTVNTLKIYPNPARDFVVIDNGNYSLISGYSLKILNTLGQSVYNSPLNQQQLNVSTQDLGGSGTYFIQIMDDTNHIVETRKLIIR
jgi:hypothetical protein